MKDDANINKRTEWLFATILVSIWIFFFIIKYSLIDSPAPISSWGYYQKDWINLAVMAFNILLSSAILIRMKNRKISANKVIPRFLLLSALSFVVLAIVISIIDYNEYQLHPSSFIPVEVMIMSRIFTMLIPFYGIIFGSIGVVDLCLAPLILSLFIKVPKTQDPAQILNK